MPLATRSKSKVKPLVQLPGGNRRTSVNSNQHLFNEPQNPSQQTHDNFTTNMETAVDSPNSSQAETVVPDKQIGVNVQIFPNLHALWGVAVWGNSCMFSLFTILQYGGVSSSNWGVRGCGSNSPLCSCISPHCALYVYANAAEGLWVGSSYTGKDVRNRHSVCCVTYEDSR